MRPTKPSVFSFALPCERWCTLSPDAVAGFRGGINDPESGPDRLLISFDQANLLLPNKQKPSICDQIAYEVPEWLTTDSAMVKASLTTERERWQGPAGAEAALQPLMFSKTTRFAFSDREMGNAAICSTRFNITGLRLASIQSTGHALSLCEDYHWTYILPTRGRLHTAMSGVEATVEAGTSVLMGCGTRDTTVEATPNDDYRAVGLLVPKHHFHSGTNSQQMTCSMVKFDNVSRQRSAKTAVSALNSYISYLSRITEADSASLDDDRFVQYAEVVLLELVRDLADLAIQSPQESLAGTAEHKHILLAEEFMRTRLADPLSVSQVAEAAGVSVRSLQMAYRKRLDTSPLARLHELRLKEIHRRLLDSSHDENITKTALTFGWSHLGRLSAAFRQRYGETPRTIRRKALQRR